MLCGSNSLPVSDHLEDMKLRLIKQQQPVKHTGALLKQKPDSVHLPGIRALYSSLCVRGGGGGACACVCLCVHACMRLCSYECVCVHMCVYVHIHLCMSVCVWRPEVNPGHPS